MCFIAIAVLMPLLATEAQLTNRVVITPDLIFWLWQSQATTNIINSVPTNVSRFEFNEQILYAVSTTKKQKVVFGRLPQEQSFIFDLHDANGNVVPKTDMGVKNSQPVNIQGAYGLKIRHTPDIVLHDYVNNLFVPSDYFVITNKGVYLLDVQMRVWTLKTNNEYGVVTSPPVRVEVERK